MKLKLFILAMGLLLIGTSCQRDVDPTPQEQEEVESMEDISPSDNFEWNTETTYQLTIETYTHGTFEVVGQNDAVYFRAVAQKRTPETFVFAVPTYETSVKVKLNDRNQTVALDSEVLNVQLF